MKKRLMFLIIAIIVIIVAIMLSITISKKKEKDRDYELLSPTEYLYYPLEINKKFGVLKRNGDVVIDAEYDEVQIPNSDKAIFIVKSDNSYSALNDKKEKLFSNYGEVSGIDGVSVTGEKVYNNTVLKYKENGKYGLINFDGNKITDAIYDEMQSLTDKYGEILVKKNGKLGVINVKGVSLVECKYDYIKGDGYVKDSSYKLGGYIVGNKVNNGYVYGYLDNKAKDIINMGQESIYRVTEIDSENNAYLVARENGRYALYKGNENLTDYKYIEMFYNNGTETFTVQKNKSYGLINIEGKVIIPEEYEELLVVGIFAKASKGDINYTFDLNGVRQENTQFVSLQMTSTDRFYISIDENYRYGIADLNKKAVVPNKYDYIEEIPSTGLLIATSGNDVTIYSAGIKELVSASNAEIKKIGEYIQIINNDESYFLTADGRKVDNKIVYLNNQLYANKIGNKWGFVNLKNNVVVNYEYDEVTEFNEFGFAGIYSDGKWGVINQSGETVLEPTYESNQVNPIFIGRYYFKDGVARDYM